MSGEDLPADTEVSPELMETLKSKSVSPEDIEVVQDEDGKALIRTKSQMKIAMGGVKEGHIFVAGDKSKFRWFFIQILISEFFVLDICYHSYN